MRFQMTRMVRLAALTILVTSTVPAFAQSAGDTVVSAGWSHIGAHSSDYLGLGYSVRSTDTLGISLTQFLTDNWAVSFDMDFPSKRRIKHGLIFTGLDITGGTAKQWAPSILAKYYFGEATTPFRPMVGLGLVRVSFTDANFTRSYQRDSTSLFFDPNATTASHLSRSWAPVFNIGASYAISKNWYAGLTMSYMRLKTEGNFVTTSSTSGYTTSSTRTYELNPISTYLNVGYRF